MLYFYVLTNYNFTTYAEVNEESLKAETTPFITEDIHEYLARCNLCSHG